MVLSFTPEQRAPRVIHQLAYETKLEWDTEVRFHMSALAPLRPLRLLPFAQRKRTKTPGLRFSPQFVCLWVSRMTQKLRRKFPRNVLECYHMCFERTLFFFFFLKALYGVVIWHRGTGKQPASKSCSNKQTNESFPVFFVLLRRYLHEPHRTLASLLASITNAHASGKKKKKRCMFVGVWVIILPQGSCSYWPEWSEGISWRLGPAGWEGTSHLALTPQCGPELLYNMAHVHMTKHLSTLLPMFLFHRRPPPHPTPKKPIHTHTHHKRLLHNFGLATPWLCARSLIGYVCQS